MGKLFKYISDGAVQESGLGHCQHCCSDQSPSYSYNGIVIDLSLSSNQSLLQEDNNIYAACIDCINSGNLNKTPYEIEQISRTLDLSECNKEKLIKAYHKIPSIPIHCQYEDHPICCEDWCEYYGTLGERDERINITTHRFWLNKPTGEVFEITDDLLADIPEDADFWDDMNLYRCLKCNKGYCIHQMT